MEKDPSLLCRQQEQAKPPVILVDGLISAPSLLKQQENKMVLMFKWFFSWFELRSRFMFSLS